MWLSIDKVANVFETLRKHLSSELQWSYFKDKYEEPFQCPDSICLCNDTPSSVIVKFWYLFHAPVYKKILYESISGSIMFIFKNYFVTSCVYDKEKDDVVWNSILRVRKGHQGFLLFLVVQEGVY